MSINHHDGYFAPDSMLYRAQSERIVALLYGLRAIYIGGTHHVAFGGTYLHTREIHTPVSRLADTAVIFEDVALGTKAEADRALGIAAAKHKKVSGTIGGTPYSAYDPDLMLWTWAVLADSSITMYDTFVRRLGSLDREALYRDWVRWGELFRMPHAVTPPTHRDFRVWWDAQMRSPARQLTDLAKLTVEAVFDYPAPLPARAMHPITTLLVLGTVPEPIRRMYGHRWSVADQLAFRAAGTGIRTGRLLVPVDGRGRSKPFYRGARAAEQRALARGHETIRGAAEIERRRNAIIA